jgi:hypothetical protein
MPGKQPAKDIVSPSFNYVPMTPAIDQLRQWFSSKKAYGIILSKSHAATRFADSENDDLSFAMAYLFPVR